MMMLNVFVKIMLWLFVVTLCSVMFYKGLFYALPDEDELHTVKLERYNISCELDRGTRGSETYDFVIESRSFKYFMQDSFPALEYCNAFKSKINEKSPIEIKYEFSKTVWDYLFMREQSAVCCFDIFSLKSEGNTLISLESGYKSKQEDIYLARFGLIAILVAWSLIILRHRNKSGVFNSEVHTDYAACAVM